MTGRTHDLAALLSLELIVLGQPLRVLNLATVFGVLLANQIGGIVPDIDQPTAPFWHNLPVGRLFGKIFGRFSGGHRYITHSLIGVLIFGAIARLILQFIHPLFPSIDNGLVWWAFIIGMVSHLIMDTFTKEGVPWFLPISWKVGLPPIRALRITTGKFFEKLLFVVMIVFATNYAWKNYHLLLSMLHSIH